MTGPAPDRASEQPSGHEADDATLLRAHVAGDPVAFGVLAARHRDRLWAVALRTMGNPDDAADGLQDGLVAAFRRAGSFRGDAAVTTWLHRVVVNACLDRLRAMKVRAADPLPDDLDEHAGRGAVTASRGVVDPADEAVTGEQRRRVLDALATLAPEQRAAVVLVDMEGYSVAEAAEVLDCAVGTVKSRCSRARAKLAGVLADLLDVSEPAQDAPSSWNPEPPSPVSSPESPRGPPLGPA